MDYSDLSTILEHEAKREVNTKTSFRTFAIVLPGITAGVLSFIMNIVVPVGRGHVSHVVLCSVIITLFVCACNVLLF